MSFHAILTLTRPTDTDAKKARIVEEIVTAAEAVFVLGFLSLSHKLHSWLILTYSSIRHPSSSLLIMFHYDTSPLTHSSTLYYINPKYLPCIP